jgi:hypothetical protein
MDIKDVYSIMFKIRIIFYLLVILLFVRCSSEPSSPSDNVLPTVIITNPVNNSEFEEGSLIGISAEVSDNAGIDEVMFYINDSLKALFKSEPFSYNWNSIGNTGTNTIQVTASDLSGNVGESDLVTIIITPIPQDTIAPTVIITNPSNNSKFVQGLIIRITAEISDNEGINNVEFYINDSLAAQFNNGSNKYTLLSSNFKIGTNTIRVLATDLSGNTSESELVTINIYKPSSVFPAELFLFNYVDDEVLQHPDSFVVYERRVILNIHLFETDSLVLNLPENILTMAYRKKIIYKNENFYTWIGEIPLELNGSIITVLKGDSSLAISGYIGPLISIVSEPIAYQIRKGDDSDPIYRLQIIDISKLPSDD